MSNKVKVLYLINSLEMGGAEKVVVDLVNGIDPARFELTICCLRKSGPCTDRIARSDVDIVEMNHGDGNDPFLPVRMARMIRGRGIDIVHCHGWGPFVEGVMAAHLGGASVMIHTDHGRVPEDFAPPGFRARLKKRIRHRAQRFFLRGVDRLVVVSEYLNELNAKEMGSLPCRISTLANGIHSSNGPFHREETRKALGLSEDDLVVFSAGRLAKIKSFETFFEAASLILRETPRARFVLAGDGPERQGLEQVRRRLGLESISAMLGHRNDIPELLAASDIFVLPSNFEATSIAVLEAMALGLPVVATRVGGNPFIVSHEETGILAPPRDAAAFALATSRLLRDADLRVKMGMAGKKRVREFFSMQKMVESHERLYLDLLTAKLEYSSRQHAGVA